MAGFLYNPVYTITDEILNLVASIAARVDVLSVQSNMEKNPKLLRLNRLRSIHDNLERYAHSDQDNDHVSDQVRRLIGAIGARALSAVELMELLDLKHRPTFRKNYLHPALEAGLIEMTLPETPNARGQKYRMKTSRKE